MDTVERVALAIAKTEAYIAPAPQHVNMAVAAIEAMGWRRGEDEAPPKGKDVVWYHPVERQGGSAGGVTLPPAIHVDFHDWPNRPATHWLPLPPLPEEEK